MGYPKWCIAMLLWLASGYAIAHAWVLLPEAWAVFYTALLIAGAVFIALLVAAEATP